MAWNQAKFGLIAVAASLVLFGTVWIIQLVSATPGPVVTGLQPMAGQWFGTYKTQWEGTPAPTAQPVTLTIVTDPTARSCTIEMRLKNPGRPEEAILHFSHALNEAGTGITTIDDAQVGRLNGLGVVTESVSQSPTNWTAGFRAMHLDGGGSTECRWSRNGDSLLIARHDRFTTGPNVRHLYSELSLQRRANLP